MTGCAAQSASRGRSRGSVREPVRRTRVASPPLHGGTVPECGDMGGGTRASEVSGAALAMVRRRAMVAEIRRCRGWWKDSGAS